MSDETKETQATYPAFPEFPLFTVGWSQQAYKIARQLFAMT